MTFSRLIIFIWLCMCSCGKQPKATATVIEALGAGGEPVTFSISFSQDKKFTVSYLGGHKIKLDWVGDKDLDVTISSAQYEPVSILLSPGMERIQVALKGKK
jgi:hypothetical protein